VIKGNSKEQGGSRGVELAKKIGGCGGLLIVSFVGVFSSQGYQNPREKKGSKRRKKALEGEDELL